MDAAIELHDVVKKFGNFRALDGLTLGAEPGSIHGFLGPNGSGKSTAIRILLAVLRADSGIVRVLGTDPRRKPWILKRVGYVAGDVSLWPGLTGGETLRALESLRGTEVDRAREKELIEAFKLDPHKKCREYSTGNRRKVSLVAALSMRAEALILDEPTAGLDPLMEQEFVEQVRLERRRGATVLLSSHIMSEVEKLCDDVTVIREGRTVESGRLEDLKHLSTHEITARVPRETDELRAIAGASLRQGEFRVSVTRDQVPATLRAVLSAGGEDITATPASLEEMFLAHYGETTRREGT